MGLRSRIGSFWNNMFRRVQVERDLNDELNAWVGELTERKTRAGMAPDRARREALVEVGGIAQVKEGVRSERIGAFVESVVRDVGYALRGLGRAPGFAIAAVLTIALGVGANSTAFMLVNAAFLRALPLEEPEEIAWVGDSVGLSYPDFADFRDQSQTLEVGAYSNRSADLSGTESPPERVPGAEISPETFSILRQTPALGRDFLPVDFVPGAEPVVLIGHSIWENRYAGDPNVVGTTIRINLRNHTIVGVLPEGEAFPTGTQIWLPLVREDPTDRTQRDIAMFGRLKPGFSFTQADAEFSTIAEQIDAAYYGAPDDPDLRTNVMPFRDRNTGGPLRTLAIAMVGAVGFVLLIACANVASLLLSRAADRTREVSVRAALGASRLRIIRQLLVESVVLSFFGGAIGLAMAIPAIRWFERTTANTGPPYWLSFEMDYRVYFHFFLVCLATGILFGIAPALRISGANLIEFAKDGGRGVSGSRRWNRLTSGLVVGELALTIVLLTSAGLMMRSFLNRGAVDWGIDIEDVLAAGLNLPTARYDTPARTAFVYSLLDRLRTRPELGAVTAASAIPGAGAFSRSLHLEGGDVANDGGSLVSRVSVTPGYFDAMGQTLVSGRDFNAADRSDTPYVAIVDELLAARYWPGKDPVGQRMRFGDDESAPWLTVIGVSSRVYYSGPEDPDDPQARPNLYVPYSQDGNLEMSILSRGGGPIETRVATLRRELQNQDADLPLINIWTLEEVLAQRTWPYRVFGTMFTAFAAGALMMSAIGLYGITAYGISRQMQEIGVRIALGASAGRILWMVVRQGVIRVATGIAIGMAAAAALGQFLASVLYEVSPNDPVTLISTSVFLALVALAACFIPARRAVSVDPVNSLRTD